MQPAEALARLEAAGTEQNRKIYRRHGASDPLFGVSFAVLDALAKEARRDQALATALWASGNYDARILACKVADPAVIGEAVLDAWLDEMAVYVLVDVFTGAVASKVPGVVARADRWSAGPRDWTAQAGWDLVSHLALDNAVDPAPGDAWFQARVARIEREIAGAGNRTRHAMNMCLCAIGGRSEDLRAVAEAAAARIGPVTVDHGQTGCTTPLVAPYIARIWDRKAAKAARATARSARA